jgi:enoyl-CoA hydratase/carnithine racemase
MAPLAAHACSSAYLGPVSIDIIDPATLRRALPDPEWREAPVTDSISPLTVVHVTSGLDVVVPPATARLLVGVTRGDPAIAPTLDIVVTNEDELTALAVACERNPRAAITLAQLLRITDTLNVEPALLAESLAYSTLLGGEEFLRWRAAQPLRKDRRTDAPLALTDDGQTLTITLNRPEVHNAYDAATRDALIDVLRSASSLGPSRSVLLRGNGSSFCSGGDLAEFGASDDRVSAHLVRTARAPGLLLHGLGTRARAQVHGACIGAGTELPAFCAHVSAHAGATFKLPEISMGLIPGAGGTVSVTRRIGRQRAAWLAISGELIDARTALGWGLVDTVFD